MKKLAYVSLTDDLLPKRSSLWKGTYINATTRTKDHGIIERNSCAKRSIKCDINM